MTCQYTEFWFGSRNLDRRNFLPADQRPEMQQPLLTEQTDVEVNPVQRSENPNRIRSILQHAWRLHDIRRMKVLRQRTRVDVVIQLLVVQTAAGERFPSPALRQRHPRGQIVQRIHAARIVDVVARNE